MSSTALPIPLSPLVGRERELAQLERLLAEARLVTLTGAGGSGKTRLAIAASTRLAHLASLEDGAPLWVDLAPLTDPVLLADHLAAVLETRCGPGRNAIEGIVATLRPHAGLLVLDNCEHLVDACAVLVETLLKGCPALRILATSREPLGIPGERLWLVPLLSLPANAATATTEEVAASEAVQLFLARAREASPSFQLGVANARAIAAICRRLDGLPLAIELAAARTRVLSAEQIAQRLDDAFRLLTTGGRTSLPRQKTLRGTFDWSFDLLAPPQQVLLRRLTVFSGSFSLEAAEAVCGGDGIDALDVLDGLSALVDRSLVVLEIEADLARYRLLETVRQYGGERLLAAGETAERRRRHAELFVAMAEDLAPALFGGAGPPAIMQRVDQDYDNFRAAMDWAHDEHGAAGNGNAEEGHVEIALRFGIALHWYWFARGLIVEGRRRLETALERSAGVAPGIRGRALVALGTVAFWLGTPAWARRGVEEGVELLRREADDEALAYGLAILGAVHVPDELAVAERALGSAARLVAPLPASVLTVFVVYWQGQAALAGGDHTLARAAFEKGVRLGRAIGHLPALAHSLCALGRLERASGRLDPAQGLLTESLGLFLRISDPWGLLQVLRELAWVAAAHREPARAARFLAGAQRLAAELGVALAEGGLDDVEGLIRELRAALGERDFAQAMADGWQSRPENLASPAPAASPASADAGGRAGDAAESGAGASPAPPSAGASPPASSSPPLVISPPSAAVAPSAVDPAADLSRAGLDVRALGPLQILEHGGAGPGSAAAGDGWSSARTRELLVFLLLHPDGATKEEVGLALWPDASAAQVRNSFHVTLHRLRTALGRAEGVRSVAGRYSLAPEAVREFDVPAFERGTRAALGAIAAGRGATAELLAALDRYRGELLASEPAGEWHLERRDELQRLYLDGLTAAGRALEREQRPAEAAAIYRRWIAADDLAEEPCRRLMLCLEQLGERREAQRVYGRLVQVLARELGVEPEPATTAIHARLAS